MRELNESALKKAIKKSSIYVIASREPDLDMDMDMFYINTGAVAVAFPTHYLRQFDWLFRWFTKKDGAQLANGEALIFKRYDFDIDSAELTTEGKYLNAQYFALTNPNPLEITPFSYLTNLNLRVCSDDGEAYMVQQKYLDILPYAQYSIGDLTLPLRDEPTTYRVVNGVSQLYRIMFSKVVVTDSGPALHCIENIAKSYDPVTEDLI